MIFILAESALELVPRELSQHPAVLAHARRRKKPPEQILLDRSYHHSAMRSIEKADKRGRSDIAHTTLLQVLDTPLNRRGRLEVYLHTFQDYVVSIKPETRIPRCYDRFVGLIEQLYKFGGVPVRGEPLLSMRKMSIGELIDRLNPTIVVALTRRGKKRTLEEVCSEASKMERPVFIVGGFARGGFNDETLRVADEAVRVYRESLSASTIAARLIYRYEVEVGIDF